jgi:hypothetical protein
MIKTKYISKVGRDYRISEHFTLGEFACSGSDMVKYSTTLLARLEKLRAFFGGGGITVNSGYRTPAHNAKVGGGSNSAHLYGQAADVVVKDKTGKIVPSKKVCLYLEGIGWKWSIGMMHNATHIDTRYENRMDETVSGYYFLNRHNLTFAEYLKIPHMVVRVSALNVRKGIWGPVLRKIPRGTKVPVFKTELDSKGRPWVKINYAKKENVAKWLLR